MSTNTAAAASKSEVAPLLSEAVTRFNIPPEQLASTLHDQARRLGLTLNTIMQGAWALLLSQFTGHRDVVFAAIASGRPPHIPGIETMVGLLITMTPVRVQLNPTDTLTTILTKLQYEQSTLTAHQHLELAHDLMELRIRFFIGKSVGFLCHLADSRGVD